MIDFLLAGNMIRSIFDGIKRGIIEKSILDSVGETLAEDIISDTDLPPFDNSAMDGFAIKFKPNIRNWSITGELSAGNYSSISLTDLSAVHIMTGSKLPENCDTIIPVEDVIIREGDIILNSNARCFQGLHVRKKGEDLESGKVAIEKNTFLKPQHIALAAACGRSKLLVYNKLKIGIIATGDELIGIDEKPEQDKIRATNLYALLAAIKEINHIPENLGIVKDNKEELKGKILSALKSDLNVLVTTGGVSVGKYDYIKEILIESGVEIIFHKVNIKPGKPVLFGVYKNDERTIPVFGLPGNPVSSLVTFDLFVKENILSMFNDSSLLRINAALEVMIKKDDNKRHFIRGFLKKNDRGDFTVSVQGKQSSGNLAQMSKANCLITIEEKRINPQAGEIVECILM